MDWKIFLFESKRGEKFVQQFVKKESPSTIAKIVHAIDLLEKHGPYLGMPHAKRFGGKLYELRIRGKDEIRILYTFLGKDIYLLHAFKKKSNKTPTKEIKTALERVKTLS